VNGVRMVVTNAMNQSLLMPYTNEDIHQVSLQMYPYKAPRCNGIHAFFLSLLAYFKA